MHATYRLRADELNEGFVQTLKNTYQQREIIILSNEYMEWQNEDRKTLRKI
jgi:hypothetical protein